MCLNHRAAGLVLYHNELALCSHTHQRCLEILICKNIIDDETY